MDTYNPTDFTSYRPPNPPKLSRRDGVYCLPSNIRTGLVKELGERGEFFYLHTLPERVTPVFRQRHSICLADDLKPSRGERNLKKEYYETEQEAIDAWNANTRSPTPIQKWVVYDTIDSVPVTREVVRLSAATQYLIYNGIEFELYKRDLRL